MLLADPVLQAAARAAGAAGNPRESAARHLALDRMAGTARAAAPAGRGCRSGRPEM